MVNESISKKINRLILFFNIINISILFVYISIYYNFDKSIIFYSTFILFIFLLLSTIIEGLFFRVFYRDEFINLGERATDAAHLFYLKKLFLRLKVFPFVFSLISLFTWLITGVGIILLLYLFNILTIMKLEVLVVLLSLTSLMVFLLMVLSIKNMLVSYIRKIGESLIAYKQEKVLKQGLFIPLGVKMILVLSILVVFSVGTIQIWSINRSNENVKKIHLQLLQSIVSNAYVSEELGENYNYTLPVSNIYMSLVDINGNVVKGKSLINDVKESIRTIIKPNSVILSNENILMISSPPLPLGKYILVWENLENISSHLSITIKSLIKITIAFLFLSSFIMLFALTDWMNALKSLKEYLKSISVGNFKRGVIIYSDDELSQMGIELNEMHSLLRNNLIELQQVSMFNSNTIDSIVDNIENTKKSIVKNVNQINLLENYILKRDKYIDNIIGVLEYFDSIILSENVIREVVMVIGKLRRELNVIQEYTGNLIKTVNDGEKTIDGFKSSVKILSNFTVQLKNKIKSIEKIIHNLRITISEEINLINDFKSLLWKSNNERERFDLIKDVTLKKIKELTEQIFELYEGLEKIEKILKIIYNLSDEIGMLSLNASITSAHSKEEGKGFSVIAQQIQQLSRTSGELISFTQNILTDIGELKSFALDNVKKVENDIGGLDIFSMDLSKILFTVEDDLIKIHYNVLSELEELKSSFFIVENFTSENENLGMFLKSMENFLNNETNLYDKIKSLFSEILNKVEYMDKFTTDNFEDINSVSEKSKNIKLNTQQLILSLNKILDTDKDNMEKLVLWNKLLNGLKEDLSDFLLNNKSMKRSFNKIKRVMETFDF